MSFFFISILSWVMLFIIGKKNRIRIPFVTLSDSTCAITCIEQCLCFPTPRERPTVGQLFFLNPTKRLTHSQIHISLYTLLSHLYPWPCKLQRQPPRCHHSAQPTLWPLLFLSCATHSLPISPYHAFANLRDFSLVHVTTAPSLQSNHSSSTYNGTGTTCILIWVWCLLVV